MQIETHGAQTANPECAGPVVTLEGKYSGIEDFSWGLKPNLAEPK